MADTKVSLTETEIQAIQDCAETFQANVANASQEFKVELTAEGNHIVMTALSQVATNSLLYTNTLFTRVQDSIDSGKPENPGVQDVIVEYYPDNNTISHAVVLSRQTTPADKIAPFVPIGKGLDIPFTQQDNSAFMRENGKVSHTTRQLDLMKTICQGWIQNFPALLSIDNPEDNCSEPIYSCTRVSGVTGPQTVMVQCTIKVWCAFTITSETVKKIKGWSPNNIEKVDFKIEVLEDPTNPSSREAVVTVKICIKTPDSRPPDWKIMKDGHRPSVKKTTFSLPTSTQRAERAQRSARADRLRRSRGIEP